MTIGEKIFKCREEKQISQEQLSLDIRVSRQAISKWETNQSIPDLDKIKILAKYFSVDISYFVDDSVEEKIIKEREKEEDITLLEKGKRKCISHAKAFGIISASFFVLAFLYFFAILLIQKVITKENTFIFLPVSFFSYLFMYGSLFTISLCLVCTKKEEAISLLLIVGLIAILLVGMYYSILYPILQSQWLLKMQYDSRIQLKSFSTLVTLVTYANKTDVIALFGIGLMIAELSMFLSSLFFKTKK